MRIFLVATAVAVFVCPAVLAQTAAPAALTADQIMTRVAANQDRSEAARTHYIYQQHIRMISRKPGGKVMCEEITDSRVSPQANGSHQQLLQLDGRHWQKGHYVHYTTLQQSEDVETKTSSGAGGKEAKSDKDDLEGMDIDLVENLRKHLSDDKSKDGLGKGLFPLTTEKQGEYVFRLAGRQKMNGRDVYHVSFRPKDKIDFDWKGEAFIDAQEFEPVVVYTQLSRKVPLAVRTLLGTNVPGLGFSVTYARQPDGVWFPVSLGTEFRLRVLFFIARDISMSLENTHFEKTHTDMRILDGVKVVENAGSAQSTPVTH